MASGQALSPSDFGSALNHGCACESGKVRPGLLERDEHTVLTQWQSVSKLLVERHGMESQARKYLEATSLLIHENRRGGVGGNGYTVHSKGESLWKSGFDVRYIHSSVCCVVSSKHTCFCSIVIVLGSFAGASSNLF